MSPAKKIPDLFGRATAILGDHSRLRETSARIEELCSDGRFAPELAGLIESFREQLGAHFVAEESEGYFGLLEQDAPELALRIARLRSDHVAMLRELDEIRGEPSAGPRLLAFLKRLRAHEHAENEVIAKYFQRD